MSVGAATDCEACGFQIGENALGIINDHVTCWDGIGQKVVTFHKRCNPAEPDLQRHHHIGLAPAVFPVTGRGIS